MKQNEFERIIIKSLYSNPGVCSKVLPELNETWFSDIDCKFIAKHIIDFNTNFSRMPNVLESRRMITEETELKTFEDCISIEDAEVNTDYILKEIEEFVRKKLMYNTSEKIVNFVKNGYTNIQGSFADELSDAESFSFDTEIGFDFFDDPQRLYEDANTKEKIFKTGIKTLDDMLMGGFHENSMSLFMSSTNVGKTLFMCSLTTNLILNGNKVLYISFEDSENKIATRIAQNMFNVSQQQYKLMSRDEFAKAFTLFKKKCGGNSLVIKGYPEASVNAMQIKSLLKDLEEKKKFRPDIIFIDYIGCMVPNGRMNQNWNTNTILQKVAQEVRAIGQEWEIPVISAAQTNRGGYNSAEVGLDDIADSYAVSTKADAIIAVTQTPEFKEQGMYSVQLLKTRFGNNKGQVATLGVDIEKQRVYELNQSTVQQSQVSVFDKSATISSNTLSGSSETDLTNLDIEI